MPQRRRSSSEPSTSAKVVSTARSSLAARRGPAGKPPQAGAHAEGARKTISRRRSAAAAVEPTTRELILTAAAAAFAERGYCGVNLADVVEDLGFTKGALYFYFPNKESLACEIVQRHFDAWELLASAALAETDDLLDALVKMTHDLADAFRSDPITRAGTRLSRERNVINAELPVPFVGWITKLTDLLRRAQDAGQLRDGVDPKALARLVVSFFYGAQAVSEQLVGRDDLHKRLDDFWSLILPQLRAGSQPSTTHSRSRAR
jgi:AcrR family transcriptional regulator